MPTLEFYKELLDLCLHDGSSLPVRGKLYQLPPQTRWPFFCEIVKSLKNEALTTGRIASYSDSYLSVAFDTDWPELDKWCDELGMAKRFDGFDVQFDYTRRMINASRLRCEFKQIPGGQPGSICCPVHILYIQTMNVPDTVESFIEELKSYKNIIALVFYGEVMPSLHEPFIRHEPLYLHALQENEAHVAQNTLMIKKPHFDLELSGEAMNALEKAAI